MKEVDFEFLIKYLEWEIARLTNANRLEMPGGIEPDISSSMTAGMVEFLTTLLQWVKSAVKVERDKIQRARDSIDATLYALMSKSEIKFDYDFRKMIDHVSGNVLATKEQHEPPQKDKVDAKTCYAMVERLEHTRLELNVRNAENTVRKQQYIKQDEILAEAADMLRAIAAEKEHS